MAVISSRHCGLSAVVRDVVRRPSRRRKTASSSAPQSRAAGLERACRGLVRRSRCRAADDCLQHFAGRGLLFQRLAVSSRVRACTSSNNRVFSMAMTAWSAKVVQESDLSFAEWHHFARRWSTITPITAALLQQRNAKRSTRRSWRLNPRMSISGSFSVSATVNCSMFECTRGRRSKHVPVVRGSIERSAIMSSAVGTCRCARNAVTSPSSRITIARLRRRKACAQSDDCIEHWLEFVGRA